MTTAPIVERAWSRPGVPHRGWTLVGCEDLEEAEHTCEMCGKEEIRYVHEVAHPRHPNLLVGCVCAERMTGDYSGPKRAERRLRSLAARKGRWLRRAWQTSAAGNLYLNVGDRNLGLMPSRFHPGRWVWRIDGEFGRATYATEAEAKGALFDELNPRRPTGASYRA